MPAHASHSPKLTVITEATLLPTAYCAESVMPSEAMVLAETTDLMVAPLAPAPAHSTSRSASVSRPPPTSPGSLPFTMICGWFGGKPNIARQPATSLSLIFVRSEEHTSELQSLR